MGEDVGMNEGRRDRTRKHDLPLPFSKDFVGRLFQREAIVRTRFETTAPSSVERIRQVGGTLHPSEGRASSSYCSHRRWQGLWVLAIAVRKDAIVRARYGTVTGPRLLGG